MAQWCTWEHDTSAAPHSTVTNTALCIALGCAAVLPRIKGKIDDVKGTTRSAPLEAITADGHSYLRFHMGPNNTVVMVDVQNNTATIKGAGTEVGANVIIYPIDKVMLSGGVR